MALHKDDLEEARLLGGKVVLRWVAPYEMTKTIMSAQEFHGLMLDFDAMISAVEQEFPECDDRHALATAMRKRWFP